MHSKICLRSKISKIWSKICSLSGYSCRSNRDSLSLSLSGVLKFEFIFWADCQGCWFWSCQSTDWIRGDDSWNRDISMDGSGGMKSITLCLISHSLTLTIYFWDPGDWTQTLQSQSRRVQLWDCDMGTFDWSCKSSAYKSFSPNCSSC